MLDVIFAIFMVLAFWLWHQKTDNVNPSENPVSHGKTYHPDAVVKTENDRHDKENRSDKDSTGSFSETGREGGRTDSDEETGTNKTVLPAERVPCSDPVILDDHTLDDLTRSSLMLKEHQRHKVRRHKPLSDDLDGINEWEDNSHNLARGNNSDIDQEEDDVDGIQIPGKVIQAIIRNKALVARNHNRSKDQMESKIQPSFNQQPLLPDEKSSVESEKKEDEAP